MNIKNCEPSESLYYHILLLCDWNCSVERLIW